MPLAHVCLMTKGNLWVYLFCTRYNHGAGDLDYNMSCWFAPFIGQFLQHIPVAVDYLPFTCYILLRGDEV